MSHTADIDAGRCGHHHGLYDVTCARPSGHDGGHIGPFYVEPASVIPPVVTEETA